MGGATSGNHDEIKLVVQIQNIFSGLKTRGGIAGSGALEIGTQNIGRRTIVALNVEFEAAARS